jgi:MFS superfamily sulfate permease-like transporter
VDGSLFFPSLQKVSDEINNKILEEEGQLKLVVLSLSSSPYIDLGATKMIRDTYYELRDKGIDFKISDITGTNRDVVRKAGLEEQFGRINSFVTVSQVIADWQVNNAQPTDSSTQ